MKFSATLFRCALALMLCAGLNGCLPPGQSQLDEEKEPHFIEGKRAINGMDYKGAIEEFEKAIEANPHNASAHFQLGWLYEEKEQDAAAAIYHYEQFLKLHPNTDNAEVIRQHIMNCKQDLAKAVLPLPTTPGVQRDLEQLVREKDQLAQENKQLRAQLDQWRAYFQAQTNRTAQSATQMMRSAPVPAPQLTATNPAPRVQASDTRAQSRSASPRMHTVQPGDTPMAIARKYGVKLDALMSANPGLDPKKLRPGQTLNLP
jgi:tetratricopeptide (TPR) repeat protein